MPTYAVKCISCGFRFEHIKKMSEELKVSCPQCSSANTSQDFDGYSVILVNKLSPKTAGQQSEYNRSQISKMMLNEEKARIKEEKEKDLPWFMNGSVKGVPKLSNPLDLEKIVDVKNAEAVQNYIEKGETNGKTI